MNTKIGLICLLVVFAFAAQQSLAAKLGALLTNERLQELEDDYKSTMSSLSQRLATSKASDKFSFARNDPGFMADIRKLGSILENIGEVKGRAAGKTDMAKAAREGLEAGAERVFDDVMDDEEHLWIIPKTLDEEFKLRH